MSYAQTNTSKDCPFKVGKCSSDCSAFAGSFDGWCLLIPVSQAQFQSLSAPAREKVALAHNDRFQISVQEVLKIIPSISKDELESLIVEFQASLTKSTYELSEATGICFCDKDTTKQARDAAHKALYCVRDSLTQLLTLASGGGLFQPDPKVIAMMFAALNTSWNMIENTICD